MYKGLITAALGAVKTLYVEANWWVSDIDLHVHVYTYRKNVKEYV